MEKFKQTSARKLTATVFWDRKGLVMVEFIQQGTTIMSQVYCETLKKLHSAIQNERSGMLTFGVVLLHDNACPHTAARTRALLEHFNRELYDHPPYSPDLTLSNYHLFIYLKNWLRPQHFSNNEEFMESVKMWLSSQVADFFDASLLKLIPNTRSDYIEK
jgi:histone-lysine N-methyltransferase SETMAR